MEKEAQNTEEIIIVEKDSIKVEKEEENEKSHDITFKPDDNVEDGKRPISPSTIFAQQASKNKNLTPKKSKKFRISKEKIKSFFLNFFTEIEYNFWYIIFFLYHKNRNEKEFFRRHYVLNRPIPNIISIIIAFFGLYSFLALFFVCLLLATYQLQGLPIINEIINFPLPQVNGTNTTIF